MEKLRLNVKKVVESREIEMTKWRLKMKRWEMQIGNELYFRSRLQCNANEMKHTAKCRLNRINCCFENQRVLRNVGYKC